MKPSSRILFYFYSFFILLDLVFIFFQLDEYRWLSKPFLMPLLIAIVWVESAKSMPGLTWYIVMALLFSWSGDVLLQAKGYFIPGLVAFLLAHLCYILYFSKSGKHQKGLVQQKPLYILPVLLYIIVLLLVIFPYLDDMAIPVIIYSITIGWMLIMAINSKGRVPVESSRLFIGGAVFFVLSDSVLAVSLFAVKSWWLGLVVMVTYALAQGLIVKGFLLSRQLNLPRINSEEA